MAIFLPPTSNCYLLDTPLPNLATYTATNNMDQLTKTVVLQGYADVSLSYFYNTLNYHLLSPQHVNCRVFWYGEAAVFV